MDILILIIVIAIVIYGLTEKRSKKRKVLDSNLEQMKAQKEHDANSDVVSYGQVQERKSQLFDVIEQNLSDHPEQSEQLKDIIEDWANLKITSFENRRSWVRSPKASGDEEE